MSESNVRSDTAGIPLELLRIRDVFYGGTVRTRHIDNMPSMAAEERTAHLAEARLVTAHFKKFLGLGRRDRIVSLGISNYLEHDKSGAVTAGALAFRPVVRKRDGSIEHSLDPQAMFNNEHRPSGPITEDDVTFCGKIAMVNDLLDGGWHAHRLSPDVVTPLDAFFVERAEIVETPMASISDLNSRRVLTPDVAPIAVDVSQLGRTG